MREVERRSTLEEAQQEHIASIVEESGRVAPLRLRVFLRRGDLPLRRRELAFADACEGCEEGYVASTNRCCRCPKGRSRARALYHSTYRAEAKEQKRRHEEVKKAAGRAPAMKWFEKDRPISRLGELLGPFTGGS